MMMKEERKCTHCNKIFYVIGMRTTDAKTLSCYYCGKRFKVKEDDGWNLADKKERWGLHVDDVKTFIKKVKEDLEESGFTPEGKTFETLNKRAGDL